MPTEAPPADIRHAIVVSIPASTRHVHALFLYSGTAGRSPAAQVQTLVGIATIQWAAALEAVAEGRTPTEPLKLPKRVPATACDNAVRIHLYVEDVALIKAVSRSRTDADLIAVLSGLLAEWAEPVAVDIDAHRR